MTPNLSFAEAEENKTSKDKYGYCTVQIKTEPTKNWYRHIIKISDIKSHVLMLNKIEHKAIDTKLCHGDNIISLNAYFMSDTIDHDGQYSGYMVIKTDKKDELFIKVNGNSQIDEEQNQATAQSTGRILGSSGNLVNIEGFYLAKKKFNGPNKIIKILKEKIRYRLVHSSK